MSHSRPILHYYMADQSWKTTSSIGIYKYSKCLLEALSRQSDPGFDVVVSISESEVSRVISFVLPKWIRLKICRDVRGSLHRVFRDQLGSLLISRMEGANITFYPKGWVPFFSFRGKSCATLHDAIIHHYHNYYPHYFSKAKVRYFLLCTKRTLRKADLIFTVSEFSKKQLLNIERNTAHRIVVMPESSTLDVGIDQKSGEDERSGILLFSSKLPHKRTDEAVYLLDRLKKKYAEMITIRVVGDMSGIPDSFDKLGRVTDDELLHIYLRSKILVNISEIEGFGLPLLEALSCGVPVLHRDAHSFREVMGPDSPGAWDGDEASFDDLIFKLLAMSPKEVHDWKDKVLDRYTWTDAAECFVKEISSSLSD